MAESLNTNLLDKLCLFLLQSFPKIKIDQLEREYILYFQGLILVLLMVHLFCFPATCPSPLAAVSSSLLPSTTWSWTQQACDGIHLIVMSTCQQWLDAKNNYRLWCNLHWKLPLGKVACQPPSVPPLLQQTQSLLLWTPQLGQSVHPGNKPIIIE